MSTDGRQLDHQISRRTVMKGGSALGAAALSARAITRGAAAAPGTRAALSTHYQSDATTLVVVMDGSPSELDPHSAYDYRSTLANQGMYEGLLVLKEDKTDEFEGLIAESWTSNDDQSVWTFTLRDGVKFHDGSPCDSAAVLASYDRFFTLGLGPVGVLTRFISDYKTQITAPDPKTIVFSLGASQPLFLPALASTYGNPIVNAAALKAQEVDGDWGHNWAVTNEDGIGTGPYKMVSFTPNSELVMEKFEDYWRGWDGAHFDRIVLRIVAESGTRRQLLEQGDADIVDSLTGEDVNALSSDPNLVVLRNTSTQVNYFVLTEGGPLASAEARQAMCWAFPYQEVIDGVFLGFAKLAQGAVAEKIHGFSPDTFMYNTDLDKAKALFASAGVPEGTTFKLTMESDVETAKTAAQLFQANLQKIGMDIEFDLTDLPTFYSSFYGDAPIEERPNLFWWGWWPDYNDAWNHLYPQVSSEAWGSKGANAGFYKNDRVDELLATAKNPTDETAYEAALAEAQQILSRDDPPAVYYAQPQWTTLYRKDVQGVFFNPINIGTYAFWKMSRTPSS